MKSTFIQSILVLLALFASQLMPAQNSNEPSVIPGQYIVVYKDDALATRKQQMEGETFQTRQLMMREEVSSTLSRNGLQNKEVLQVYETALIGFAVRGLTEAEAKKLLQDEQIAFVEPDQIVYLSVENDRDINPEGVQVIDNEGVLSTPLSENLNNMRDPLPGSVCSFFEINGTPVEFGAAVFGPYSFNVTGELVLVIDDTPPTEDGCGTITNDLTGKIALVERGTCAFSFKVYNAQQAGAIAVIIYNNIPGSPPSLGAGVNADLVTIPSISISDTDGQAVIDALNQGTVTATLSQLEDIYNTQCTPWGITRVGGGLSGAGKRAWVIDSGIDLDHPDLNVNAVLSHSVIDGESTANDLNGHGTHVAGTIAAKDNGFGVIGVAAGAEVVAVKVFPGADPVGPASNIIAGLNYVAVHAAAGDVVNYSIGGTTTQAEVDALLAVAAVCPIVKSAGNDAEAAVIDPQLIASPNFYVISAMDRYDNFASFSNFGNPPINYCAPGVRVASTWKNGTYRYLNGTSMAAPHVAGILLLGDICATSTVNNDPDGNPDPIAELIAATITGDEGPFCPFTTIEFSAPDNMASYSWSLTNNIGGFADIGSWDDNIGFTPGPADEQDVQVVGICGTVFTLTLTVTNDQGCSASTNQSYVVGDSEVVWVNEPQDHTLTCDGGDLEAELQQWLSSMEVSSNCGTGNATFYLQLLQVNSPGNIQGAYFSTAALFGPSEFSITGDLEMADPALACGPLQNDLTGKIAVIDRGSCPFTDKVQRAEAAGAIGAIIVNSVPGERLMTMSGTATPTINIPSLYISYEDGELLKQAMDDGVVNASLTNTIDLLQPGDYPVLFQASNVCFQFISKEVNLTTPDFTPEITCPVAVEVFTDALENFASNVDIGVATATSDCGIAAIEGVRSDALGLNDPYPIGVTTITWTAENGVGATASCIQTVTVIQGNLLLQDVIIFSDESECFDAIMAIVTAGYGTDFIVEDGATVELVAGYSIIMKAGTRIEAGSEVHAHIDPEWPFCGARDHFLATEAREDDALTDTDKAAETTDLLMVDEMPGFSVYPNPTRNKFTLEVYGMAPSAVVTVEVFGLRGERILRQEVSADEPHIFSLGSTPPGIYVIRLSDQGLIGVQRIIKQHE